MATTYVMRTFCNLAAEVLIIHSEFYFYCVLQPGLRSPPDLCLFEFKTFDLDQLTGVHIRLSSGWDKLYQCTLRPLVCCH